MHRDPRAYLWDIKQAADAILRFMAGIDYQRYEQTELVQSAVERKFEIIGEALGKFNKIDPDLARRIPDIRDVIAFRNVLIHGYAAVEHQHVWRIVQESMPELRLPVGGLLDELGGRGT